jgi:hypothetical protein
VEARLATNREKVMAKVNKKLLKWRKRQKRGAIMKPETFEGIKAKAAAEGATNPEKVAGKAYWDTAKAKFARRKRKK